MCTQPVRASPVRAMRSRLHSGLRPAKSLSATGATWVIPTGRNGNPAAPPALLTRIQQSMSSPPQARGDLLRAGYLAHQRINMLAHPGSLPGRCVKLQYRPHLPRFGWADWIFGAGQGLMSAGSVTACAARHRPLVWLTTNASVSGPTDPPALQLQAEPHESAVIVPRYLVLSRRDSPVIFVAVRQMPLCWVRTNG